MNHGLGHACDLCMKGKKSEFFFVKRKKPSVIDV
jgi:hypothetical protein